MRITKEHSAKFVVRGINILLWSMDTKPIKNWKKAVEKMRKSDAHIRYCEAEVLAAKAEKEQQTAEYHRRAEDKKQEGY